MKLRLRHRSHLLRALVLCCCLGALVLNYGGWGKVVAVVSSLFKRRPPVHTGHSGYGRAPMAELPDPDRPHSVFWFFMGGEYESNYAQAPAVPLPRSNDVVVIGLKDDGTVVWRKAK